MSQPLVSVALATYNGAPYLRQQLDSIYRQSWRNLEVVATDDASTDGTAAILEDYARRRGLRFEVNPRRLGLVRNFERAISLCRGEYIALCDQDDLWKERKVEKLVGNLGLRTLIYCNTQEVLNPQGEPRVEVAFEPIFRFARAHGTGKPTRYLLAENWVVSHSVLFRRELVEHALPIPAGQVFHDAWLALVASKLGGIKYLDKRLQVYREHADSFTYRPPEPPGRRPGKTVALLSGRRGAGWRQRCAAETVRLQGALSCPLLEGQDRAFIDELMAYYRAGLTKGWRRRSLVAGFRVAPYFSTLHNKPLQRVKLFLRPVLLGL